MGKTSYEEYTSKIIVVVIPLYFCRFASFVLKHSISHTANVRALLRGIISSELYFAFFFCPVVMETQSNVAVIANKC